MQKQGHWTQYYSKCPSMPYQCHINDKKCPLVSLSTFLKLPLKKRNQPSATSVSFMMLRASVWWRWLVAEIIIDVHLSSIEPSCPTSNVLNRSKRATLLLEEHLEMCFVVSFLHSAHCAVQCTIVNCSYFWNSEGILEFVQHN